MSKISQQFWGVHKDQEIYLFKIENAAGAYIELTNYGATIVSAYVPDRHQELGNVILGFPTLQAYLDDNCYLGATIGRFANRIAKASFVLDEKVYALGNNDNGNSNHGGYHGFNTEVFSFKTEEDVLSFELLSADGDGGFPGNLKLKVSYRWTDDFELLIDYTAVTDQKTVANFTNHAYFNLSGKEEKILDHQLTVYSELVVAAGTDHIPTGLIVPADDLSFKGNTIREKLIQTKQEEYGLNTCYFLDQKEPALIPAALLYEEGSGRTMEVLTSYPGLLLYTAGYLNSKHSGNYSRTYEPFDGLCLECQYLPDSPNHAHFPSSVLIPGEVFSQHITFRFGTQS